MISYTCIQVIVPPVPHFCPAQHILGRAAGPSLFRDILF
jgi:hypothetical protein